MWLTKLRPIFRVSFLKPNEKQTPSQASLQIKDPIKDIQQSMEEMKRKLDRQQIYRTATGLVPESISKKWSGSKEITVAEKQIDLPYNFEGVETIPDIKTSFMGNNLLMWNRVRTDKLMNYLLKVYKGVLYSMAALDEEFLYEYTEKSFSEKVLKSMRELRDQGDELLVLEDKYGDNGTPVPYFCQILESALIRGLQTDREKNGHLQDYHYYRDLDFMGLVIFTPMKVADPQNFIRKEEGDKIYEDFQNMVMRVMLRIQSPLRMKIVRQNGQIIFADADNYSFNHLALFESQLIPPLKRNKDRSYQLTNYQSWLQNFQFGTWKLVDIDNWMEGNPLILQGNDREDYKDDIFAETSLDQRFMIDIRKV